MDNHKDFIHIDDVFKELRNGEEPEGSGAWLRMKDLLDKELPVGTPVASGWSFRRYMLPLVALLLIGGGLAYYEMKDPADGLLGHNTYKDNTVSGKTGSENLPAITDSKRILPGNDNQEGSGTPASSASGGRQTKPSGHGPAVPAVAGEHPVAAGRSITGNATSSGQEAQPGNHNAGSGKGQGQATAPTAHNATKSIASGTTAQNGSKNNTPAAAAAKETAENRSQNVHAVAGTLSEEHIIEKIQPRTQGGTKSAGNGSGGTTPQAGMLASAGADHSKAAAQPLGSGNMKEVATTLNNKKIVKDKDGNLYKEERDTFKRMDLVERTLASNSRNGRAPRTTLDTVAVTRIEKIRYVPLSPVELIALKKLAVDPSAPKPVPVPMASLREHTLSKEMVSLVPLTNYKVASRKMEPGKFNQLIQNTSRGISNYFDGSRNFYAAFILGGNASFGNPGSFGMQMGIAGLYSIGERLTLAAELKYVNHYFSNYSLQDQSVTFENVNGQQISGADWLFSGTKQTTTAVYKVNSFGALELPVTLSYNLGRVSVFAGLDMAYAFPIKWNKELTLNSADVQQVSQGNQNPFVGDAFRLNEQKDFASRLGLGYVWGLSYDLSRKVSLDARVSQILWDNGNGTNDAINRLFRIPTVQFSFGYYLGRKEKVIYIMDRR